MVRLHQFLDDLIHLQFAHRTVVEEVEHRDRPLGFQRLMDAAWEKRLIPKQVVVEYSS